MEKMNRKIVAAICRGYYERRRRMKGKTKPNVVEEYKRLNDAIEKALFAVCPDQHSTTIIRKAITDGAGYDRIGELYFGHNSYYKYKRDVFEYIANELNLE